MYHWTFRKAKFTKGFILVFTRSYDKTSLCSTVLFNAMRKRAMIALIWSSKDFGWSVDTQSIKWISCKGMYKGYRRALLYEHGGDPTKQFSDILSSFFKENLIMFSPT